MAHSLNQRVSEPQNKNYYNTIKEVMTYEKNSNNDASGMLQNKKR